MRDRVSVRDVVCRDEDKKKIETCDLELQIARRETMYMYV